ncbi:MAG: hemerythrin domain-containing protein [Pseudomonadota bacterium]
MNASPSTSASKKSSAKKTIPSAVKAKVSVKKAAPKKAAVKKKAAPKSQDALALLKADHRLVDGLFADFEKTRSARKQKEIVERICVELTAHATIEEEIFYPAVKEALKDKELVPEASVEHASVKDLIAQVRGIEPDGEMYTARVKVMGEFVKHHVKEEQNEMFTKVKKSRLDLQALGAQMAARKEELLTQAAASV